MNEKEFYDICKQFVLAYVRDNMDKTDGNEMTTDDVFVVWMCKTLQNNKALVSTNLRDRMYYEITYNGDKKELYLDAYKKWENVCIRMHGKEENKN